MTKVTVLVAVYNASRYLSDCLNSLLEQTLSDIQVVCVDDASTDDSLSILQQYGSRDKRIEVVHLPENQGQGHARNIGLQMARGEYVCFLDADDWLERDALGQCVSVFAEHEDTDSVLFSVSMDYADHAEPYVLPVSGRLTGEEAFRMSLDWQIHGVYMVRRSIHLQYPYDETCKTYADDNTTRLHYFASRWVAVSSGVYHYRQHTDSATHAISVRRYDYLQANESMRRMLLQMNAGADVLTLYENHRWHNLVDVCMFHHVHGSELAPDERHYGLDELRRTWQGIDRRLLTPQTTRKLGYCPMRWWWLFRVEEWLYFTLRGWFGKNS